MRDDSVTGRSQLPKWQRILAALGKAACYLTLFLGWQLLVSTIYTATITAELMVSAPFAEQGAVYEAVMAKTMEISLLSGLLTLGSVAVFFKLRRRSLRQELWLRPVSGAAFGWCAALAFCLYWLVTLVLACLPENWLSGYMDAAGSLEQTGVTAVLATALVAPVVEEVIFRGLIFTRLRRIMPGWLAVALSAAIFGACHGEFVWFCYAFVLGGIFALLAERTRSILPGMLMHVVFNGTNELLSLLEDWEPNAAETIVILLLATAGTVFCAFRVRGAVSRMSVRFTAAEQPEPELTERPVRQPAQAMWDPDSGPRHKFPPIQQ